MNTSDRRAWSFVLAFLVVAGSLAVLLFAGTQDAHAAWSYSCSSPPGAPSPEEITDDAIETRNQRIEDAANCLALAERLEAVNASLGALDTDGATAQRVSLAPLDRNRLDLVWWGVWAIVGLTLVLLFSSKWHSAWRFMRG